MIMHATCVALPDPAAPGDWAGVLLQGGSGAGKSDLALRLLSRGARLVADDQVVLAGEGGRLRACAPAAIAGLLEVRGLGVLRWPEPLTTVDLRLAVAPIDASAPPARLPEPETMELQGGRLPLIRLDYFASSAPERVSAALAALRLGLFAAAANGLNDGLKQDADE